ncbi:MAG: phosphate ABC transporter ATP-binding protein [Thermodesulfobacteriota bacterium]
MDDMIKIRTTGLSFSYNDRVILREANAVFAERRITAIVGPSGSGKSTFLLTLNRLWETIPGCRLRGRVEINFDNHFQDIYRRDYPLTTLRRQVGMVFQTPNPLPMSIGKNVAFPLLLLGGVEQKMVRSRVEEALRRVGLWKEVGHRLHAPALELSGGQQQRLCIARALILRPEVLLLDEPTSSLDQRAAGVIERVLIELKESCTILLVSHYLDQVKRIADAVVELADGKLRVRS